MPPAARVGDMHVCPMVTVLVPHVGGPILPPCALPVIISGMPAARITDLLVCVGPPDIIVQGSMTVFIQGLPAARMMDMTAHGGMIVLGDFKTWIGDSGSGSGGGGGSMAAPKLPALPAMPALPAVPAMPALPSMPAIPSLPDIAAPVVPGANPADTAPADPPEILERRAANQQLLQSPQFPLDCANVNVTPQQIQQMLAKECPLGFENPQQFQRFQQELQQALQAAGIDDAQTEMKGTATAFYSENPKKPLGHHFDANPKEPADFDFGIASPKLLARMAAAGKSPSPKMPHIFKTRDLMEVVPELKALSDKWTKTLGRDVNFVAKTASTLPPPAPTDFRL